MSKPVLRAVFQPQAWIFDDAVDCARAVPFDAAPSLFEPGVSPSWLADVLTGILDGGIPPAGLDEVAEDLARDHGGPFTVRLDAEDLIAFLSELGAGSFEEGDEISESDAGRIGSAYAAL